MKLFDNCIICESELTEHSPNGFDKILECTNCGHRHMIKGRTGEYSTMHSDVNIIK